MMRLSKGSVFLAASCTCAYRVTAKWHGIAGVYVCALINADKRKAQFQADSKEVVTRILHVRGDVLRSLQPVRKLPQHESSRLS